MISRTLLRTAAHRTNPSPSTLRLTARYQSTLAENPNIYTFPTTPSGPTLLTLLPTTPPNPTLSLGTTTALPPTPSTFTPNPHFLPILSSVLSTHASSDPLVISQAAVYASSQGFSPSGPSSYDGSGGAAHQGGAGSGSSSRGGWIHVSDLRNPPDWGRIAWPEDIFGSVEVDGAGRVITGTWSESGTYRVVTREGILGLSPYLMEKLVERLRELEGEMKKKEGS